MIAVVFWSCCLWPLSRFGLSASGAELFRSSRNGFSADGFKWFDFDRILIVTFVHFIRFFRLNSRPEEASRHEHFGPRQPHLHCRSRYSGKPFIYLFSSFLSAPKKDSSVECIRGGRVVWNVRAVASDSDWDLFLFLLLIREVCRRRALSPATTLRARSSQWECEHTTAVLTCIDSSHRSHLSLSCSCAFPAFTRAPVLITVFRLKLFFHTI